MKRSGPDIIATILEASNGGVGKTKLLTQANLTSSQFRKYIDILIQKGLLTELGEGGHLSYRTTTRGLKYLALYNSIRSVAYLNA